MIGVEYECTSHNGYWRPRNPDGRRSAASGYGSRGGPGYRGPNGQCVGWANLNRVCGVPPTKNCTNEGEKDESAAATKGDSGKEAPRKPF